VLKSAPDYDETYPPGINGQLQNTWPVAVQPYVKNQGIFRCPSDGDNTQDPSTVGSGGTPISYACNGLYGWNGTWWTNFGVMGEAIPDQGMSVSSVAAVGRPSETVLLTEKHNTDVRKMGRQGNLSAYGPGCIIQGTGAWNS